MLLGMGWKFYGSGEKCCKGDVCRWGGWGAWGGAHLHEDSPKRRLHTWCITTNESSLSEFPRKYRIFFYISATATCCRDGHSKWQQPASSIHNVVLAPSARGDGSPLLERINCSAENCRYKHTRLEYSPRMWCIFVSFALLQSRHYPSNNRICLVLYASWNMIYRLRGWSSLLFGKIVRSSLIRRSSLTRAYRIWRTSFIQ